mmetsp:Transcript_94934/g.274533  ORF Transcript_94934/g.274533 Transcript_94934/m.274533 type:complete len:445 (+) Transcript_94934:70-1404(+)
MFRFRPAAGVALAASLALGTPGAATDAVPSFDEHLEEHGLSYSGGDYAERKALFEKTVEAVKKQNSKQGALWKAAVNKFAALTEQEMQAHYGYMKTTERKRTFGKRQPPRKASVTDFDWRKERPDAVSPVKSQGSCGSCWAFAATETMETVIALEHGTLFDLSPQQLASCMPNPEKCGGSGGCQGATAQLAYDYTAKHGITTIWKWPYLSGQHGENGECDAERRPPVAFVTGFSQLVQNDPEELLNAVMVSPVAVSVAASNWGYYSTGIFDGCSSEKNIINHAVVLMGFGVENSVAYWTIRNSWGVGWGEKGYIRLQRFPEGEACGVDDEPLDGYSCAANAPETIKVCGMCGVLSDSSYPTGPKLGAPQGPPDDPAINKSSAQRLFEVPMLPATKPAPSSSSSSALAVAMVGLASVVAGLAIRARRGRSSGAMEVPLQSDDEEA